MPHRDVTTQLGHVGVVLGHDGWDDSRPAAAAELEELGYSTLWLCGAPFDLDRIPAVVSATRRVTVSTAVIPADTCDADAVGSVVDALEAEHPGRFVAGLGGAHGPRPLRTLREYLDRLDRRASPPTRLLSALGPKMLDLAAQRAAGAVPVLATPEYTASARARLGPGATLAVEQLVALDTDPVRAREAARGTVGFLRDVEGGYARHLARQGFDDEDVAALSERLVDAVVACGDVDRVVERVAEHHAAGADHVALMVIPPQPGTPLMPAWRTLAGALGTTP